MIPFNTTTIRVESPEAADDSGDPYNPAPRPDREVWATGVRAVFTARLFDELHDVGDAGRLRLVMSCDPCRVDHRCKIVDETTGREYEVTEVFSYTTPPLDYVKLHLDLKDDGGILNNGRT